MTPDVALSLARDASVLILLVAGPILAVGLLAGLVVSIIQVATQLHEAALAFIPKLVAVFVVLALFGHWMLQQLLGYTAGLLSNLAVYGR
jgi:flagellar biosynthetic protein FliQ